MSVDAYFGGLGERIRLAKGSLEEIGIRVQGPVLSGEAGVRERQTSVFSAAERSRDWFPPGQLDLARRAAARGGRRG